MSLVLKDSNFQEGVIKWYHEQSAGYMRAVDELQRQFNTGTLEVVCLQSYNPRSHIECPIWYEVKSYDYKRGYQVVNECRFFSSHYIGRFTHDGYSIIVNPRYGDVFGYLIGYSTNLYLPMGSSELAYNTENNSYWLIALIWKAMLNKALTVGQIPKEYIFVRKNQKHFRGHLCINKHIHTNLCNATRFYCSYKKLSMDNTINQTIRAVYGILKHKGVSSVIGEFEAYDKYLESMGVNSVIDNASRIDNIRYTRMSEPYRPVLELSKTILNNYKAESTSSGGTKSDVSYFIDIAELWEMYLLKLLQNNLSQEYRVFSPNSNYGTNLLDCNMREIRPDILIEKDGRVIMIIDAKYKNYSHFGKSSDYGIHRDDLYQMSTYLYHFGAQNKSIIGIFTSPVENKQTDDIHFYSANKKHRIGLVNLEINSASGNIQLIHEFEKNYINQIERELDSIKD
ncbi:MAG: hypothetical protein J5711_00145 [Bacteroidales bacterium]|nr:hypothetical protein [Bacteroidales bacterium]